MQTNYKQGDHVKNLRILAIIVSIAITLNAEARGNGHIDGYNRAKSPIQNPPTSSGQVNCMDNGKVLNEMNDQVLQWKATQASGFQTRALISGTVDEVFPDHSGHKHFSIKVGTHNDDHIEIVYNESFGAMPLPQTGDPVEACGDFIVATKQNHGYPPSPDGAIIHWVHKSPHSGHDDGFVILKGALYGNSH